ncbi:hypothetical protein GCM10010492_17860 [Saccharothrix mutabilis subsp. mutabilis]|uniref:Uncharacterized protein n=1 Tax=Saccharothrix mutabilis subsp. mutabilis TaxID=66855 RepID=A0ABP3D0T9_9PSEU
MLRVAAGGWRWWVGVGCGSAVAARWVGPGGCGSAVWARRRRGLAVGLGGRAWRAGWVAIGAGCGWWVRRAVRAAGGVGGEGWGLGWVVERVAGDEWRVGA